MKIADIDIKYVDLFGRFIARIIEGYKNPELRWNQKRTYLLQ